MSICVNTPSAIAGGGGGGVINLIEDIKKIKPSDKMKSEKTVTIERNSGV